MVEGGSRGDDRLLASPLGVAADLCGGLRSSWSHRVAAGSTPSPMNTTQRGLYSGSEHLSPAGWAAPLSPHPLAAPLAWACSSLHKGWCVPAEPAWPQRTPFTENQGAQKGPGEGSQCVARAWPGHDGEGLGRDEKGCGADDPANVPGSSSSSILPVQPEVGLDLGFLMCTVETMTVTYPTF